MSDHTLTHRRPSREIEVVPPPPPPRDHSNGHESTAATFQPVRLDSSARQPSTASSMSSKRASKVVPLAMPPLGAGGTEMDLIAAAEPVAYTPAEDKRVARKIDRILIPLLMSAYCLQYVDKSAMSYAAVFSFRQDNHLTPSQYRWLGSCYYLGYLFFEFPGSYLLQRLKLSLYLGCMIVVWGVLLLCMVVPRSFAGLAVIRTLLGAAEACVTPGFVLLLARFYKREEQPFKVGLFYCCNGIGSGVGALISYGTGHIGTLGRIHNYHWIFLIAGILTLVCGAAFLVLCPDQAESAWFLCARERQVATERLRANQSSLSSKTWKWAQFGEAFAFWKDPQAVLLFLIILCYTIPNGGIGNFYHLILQSYGFDAYQTILLGLPAAAIQTFFPLSSSWVARRYKDSRIWVMVAWVLPSLLGVALQYGLTQRGARLFGYYIIGSFVGSVGQGFAMPGANVTGYTKRITVGGTIFVAYAVGNLIGPQLFDSTESPAYRSGMLTCIICFSISIPLCLSLRLAYIRANRQRDRIQESLGQKHDPQAGTFLDQTDTQNINFRYVL
ncbi:hypothetical protein NCC49_004864 [Naganishia albida]|nr:hypothetical protein NCC49_004864 [Naganishia albida]